MGRKGKDCKGVEARGEETGARERRGQASPCIVSQAYLDVAR